MSKVYLDTSFFIGLLEDKSRQKEYANILKFHGAHGDSFFTSQLTEQEFLVRYYDKYRKSPDCESRVNQAIESITNIASVYGISEEVCKRSARFMSVWGELKHAKGQSPRDKKFRWDAIHLATADVLQVGHVYACDGPWNDFPRSEIPGIVEIVCPPKLPQPLLDIGWPAGKPEDKTIP